MSNPNPNPNSNPDSSLPIYEASDPGSMNWSTTPGASLLTGRSANFITGNTNPRDLTHPMLPPTPSNYSTSTTNPNASSSSAANQAQPHPAQSAPLTVVYPSLRAAILAGVNVNLSPAEEAIYRVELAEAEANRRAIGREWLINYGLHDLADLEIAQDEAFIKMQHLQNLRRQTEAYRQQKEIDRQNRDFFGKLANYTELTIEVASFMSPKDLLSLYSIHKEFNAIVNGHLTHTMKLAAERQAKESSSVFTWPIYSQLCIPDPVGRLAHDGRVNAEGQQEVHSAPSLKWFQMVVHREKVVRDILACLARQHLRCPKGMSKSLKKMWILMDIATSNERLETIKLPFFTSQDLFNMQFFFIRLDMRFNDPILGPGSDVMRQLMMGQRGLTCLRDLLTRAKYHTRIEIVELIIKYDYRPAEAVRHLPIFNVHPNDIGRAHLEAWGEGDVHLLRPDELVVWEACRRDLGLKHHIMNMMLWGYNDPFTGKLTPPTPDEMYMSDDEDDRDDLTRIYEAMGVEDEVERNRDVDHRLGNGHKGELSDIIYDDLFAPGGPLYAGPDAPASTG